MEEPTIERKFDKEVDGMQIFVPTEKGAEVLASDEWAVWQASRTLHAAGSIALYEDIVGGHAD